MTSRAETLLSRAAAQNKHAVDLAMIAAPAVRIEPAVLRTLRLEFLPASDPSAEADLWMSPLVGVRSASAITLVPEVASVLRQRLWEVDADRGRFRTITDRIAELHAGLAPLLRLEEKLIRLCYEEANPVDGIDAEVAPLVRTIHEQPDKAATLASWALRAIPRLPEAARRSSALWALALVGSARFGVQPLLEGDPPEGAVRLVPGLLPPDLPSVDVEVRRSGSILDLYLPLRAVEAATPADIEGGALLTVPATYPVIVLIREITISPPAPRVLGGLTYREHDVAQLLSQSDLSYKQIAEKLRLAEGTIRKLTERVYRAVGVTNRAALTQKLAGINFTSDAHDQVTPTALVALSPGDRRHVEVKSETVQLRTLRGDVFNLLWRRSFAQTSPSTDESISTEVEPVPPEEQTLPVESGEVVIEASEIFRQAEVPPEGAVQSQQTAQEQQWRQVDVPPVEMKLTPVDPEVVHPRRPIDASFEQGEERVAEAVNRRGAHLENGTLIYISASRKDDSFVKLLRAHLIPLRELGAETWHRNDLRAGERLSSAFSRLDAARIVVALISADYLADETMMRELTSAEHSDPQPAIVPVIVRPCAWSAHPLLGDRLVLPRDGVPISSRPDIDEAMTSVAEEIAVLVSSLRAEPADVALPPPIRKKPPRTPPQAE